MTVPIVPEPTDLAKSALDAWQASVNAETVGIQQQEIRDLRAALAEMTREKGKVYQELRDLKVELSIAVVKLASGKRTTLAAILENEAYRPICFCNDADCTGCVPIDARTRTAIEACLEAHAELEARIA